ncbi:MAG: biopolymer transporter ExbD [Thermodesulfobacteriota bacterium]|nr:biopolymer transporter ExbD [Thermodesulfobacteriota bacterium]
MKINVQAGKKPRVEILPLIDIVFLLLVFFIYAMLSMAVHRGFPVSLPTSSTARIDKNLILSVTIKADGSIYLNREMVSMKNLRESLKQKTRGKKETGVLLFADRTLSYQKLFKVLDQIRMAGLNRISLQAEVD